MTIQRLTSIEELDTVESDSRFSLSRSFLDLANPILRPTTTLPAPVQVVPLDIIAGQTDMSSVAELLQDIASLSGFEEALARINPDNARRAAMEMNRILLERGRGLDGDPGYRQDAAENTTEYRLASIAHGVFQEWDAVGLNKALEVGSAQVAKVLSGPRAFSQLIEFERILARQLLDDSSLVDQLFQLVCDGPGIDLEDAACRFLGEGFQFQDLTDPILLNDPTTLSDEQARTRESVETPWWLALSAALLAIANGALTLETAGVALASITAGAIVSTVPRDFLLPKRVPDTNTCDISGSARANGGFTEILVDLKIFDRRTKQSVPDGGRITSIFILKVDNSRKLVFRAFDKLPKPSRLAYGLKLPRRTQVVDLRALVIANPIGYSICKLKGTKSFRR